MTDADYDSFMNNIIDLVREQQAKLGYRRECVRLYYPAASLGHLLGVQADCDGLQEILDEIPAGITDTYGMVTATHKGERFCITLSEAVSEYVHEHMQPNEFIVLLVELLAKHDTTLDGVKALFRSYDSACVIQPIDNGEFDELIYFVNIPDRYYYCFKDEGCHIIYHRFLPEDYRDLFTD